MAARVDVLQQGFVIMTDSNPCETPLCSSLLRERGSEEEEIEMGVRVCVSFDEQHQSISSCLTRGLIVIHE